MTVHCPKCGGALTETPGGLECVCDQSWSTVQQSREMTALRRKRFAQQQLGMWCKLLAMDGIWSKDRFLDQMVQAALAVSGADSANVQLFRPQLRGLELVAQKGFQQPFLEFFRFVGCEHCACGAAMRSGRSVIIEDVANSPVFAHTPQLEAMLEAGSRAVESIPLHDAKGGMLGMMSVHYRRPYPNRNGESARLKVLASEIGKAMGRQAAGSLSLGR